MAVFKVSNIAFDPDCYALVEAMSRYDAKRYVVEMLDPVDREPPADFDNWVCGRVFSGVQFFTGDPIKKRLHPEPVDSVLERSSE